MHSFRKLSIATSSLGLSLLLAACGGSGGTGGGGSSSTGGAGGTVTTSSTTESGSTTATSSTTTTSSTATTTTTSSEVVIANVPDDTQCPAGSQFSVSPVLPNEAGHYATTRLTPPSYPFEVSRVSYRLAQAGGVAQCSDQSFAHEVQVYVSSAAKPSDNPSTDGTLVDTIDVPAGSSSGRTVDLALTAPVTLETGESLYVAVQLVGSGAHSLCIGSCAPATPIAGVDFWSNAAAEPFSYQDMVSDFGFTYNFMTRAHGTAK